MEFLQGQKVKQRVFVFVLACSMVLGLTCFFPIGKVFADTITATGKFEVIGSKIYDPQGNRFVAKGVVVNGPGWVWPRETTQDAGLIADSWKFNLVRVATLIYKYQGSTQYYNNTNEAIVNAFTPRKVVTMIHAGDNDFSGAKLEDLKNYWRQEAAKYKNNPYVWFNITGEVGGGNYDPAEYLRVTQSVISVIRDEVGATNVITVGGSYWGQEVGEWNTSPVQDAKSYHLPYGDQVKSFNGKTYPNIVFQFHVYDQWNSGTVAEGIAKLEDYINRMYAKGHAVFIGEWGSSEKRGNNLNYPTAARAVFDVAYRKNVGQAVWSWPSGDSIDLTIARGGDGGGYLINSPTAPTNLTWFGKQVWDLNRKPLAAD